MSLFLVFCLPLNKPPKTHPPPLTAAKTKKSANQNKFHQNFFKQKTKGSPLIFTFFVNFTVYIFIHISSSIKRNPEKI